MHPATGRPAGHEHRTCGFTDIGGVEHLLAKVVAEVDSVQDAAGGLSSMVDFDERDLLAMAEAAGFVDLQLTLEADISETPMWQTRDWNVFLDSSPNPLAPTFRGAGLPGGSQTGGWLGST